MPPPPRVSRELIEEAAFVLVRTEGLSALSARRIAEQLGVSTQPVYTAWASMAALQDAVVGRVEAFVVDFLAQRAGDDDEPPFLQIGFRTLLLARDEPALFAIATDAQRRRGLDEPPGAVLEAMRADPRLAALSQRERARVHRALWLFTQGVAQFVTPSCTRDELGEAREQLRFVGEAIIGHAHHLHVQPRPHTSSSRKTP